MSGTPWRGASKCTPIIPSNDDIAVMLFPDDNLEELIQNGDIHPKDIASPPHTPCEFDFLPDDDDVYFDTSDISTMISGQDSTFVMG